MKKLIIRILLLLAVFAAVFAGVYFYQNRKPAEEMVQMDQAALPVMYMRYAGERLNRLHGYVQEMDAASMRDTLTPVGEDRSIGISVDTYGSSVTQISYEVRSLDKERLIERTALTEWETEAGSIEAELRLENLIEEGREYLLTLHLTTGDRTDISYYTRILMGMEGVEEKLAYALDFSSKTFDKEEAESLIMYLESGSRGDNTNFGNVDIYSSFNQITWGDLEPVRLSEPVPAITEVNGAVTGIRLEYQVEIKNMYGTTEVCNVNEFFRTNYTPERTYLLTYERKMNQKFRAVSENVTSSRINLGISENTNMPVISNESGTMTAFTKERELWKYDSRKRALDCIFSFRDSGDDGIRDEWNQHEIIPVQLDEAGNLYFVVYGYMNRGIHEGCVGLTLYYYREESGSVEEILFIPYGKSFAYLRETMGELFYITPGRHFCFLMGGSLCSVDLASLEYVYLVEGLREGSYVLNEAGNTVAWEPEGDILQSTQIKKLELDTNTENTITADGGILQVLGFIQDDLVYGMAYPEDIQRTITGDTRIYMSGLSIVDSNGREVGSYGKQGYYFTEAQITDGMITLTRWQKAEGGGYESIPEDYITNNTGSGRTKLSVTMLATELKKKEAGIPVTANPAGGSLQVAYTQEVIYPEGRQLILNEEPAAPSYYVYAKGGLADALEDVSAAIQLADEQAGVVISSGGEYIWKRGNANTGRTLQLTMPETEESSLARALNALLRYAGVTADSESRLAAGELPIEIINDSLGGAGLDLAGLSLRQTLYFVDSGRPVLARTGEDEYVLIIGFDAYNAVLLDTGGSRGAYRVGLEDGTELFEAAGNEFIGYGE